MDKAEARELLDAEIEKLRARSYQDLVRLIDNQEDYWVTGQSGARYGVEVDVVYDSGSRSGDGTMRIMAMIDDGGPSALRPLTSNFLLAPDGTFVGE